MYLNLLSFDLSAIDTPTIFFVLAAQLVAVLVLFLLYRLYKIVLPVSKTITAKKSVENGLNDTRAIVNSESIEDVNAAIALALHLYLNEIHDQESNVITIQRVSKTYSPWSSKIYSMRNFR